jgi:DNA-binding SARP family transcriptional activator
VEFGILGPLEVRSEGKDVPLPGRKQRALLALFLLHANELLTSDQLIEALWRERPPNSGANALQARISQLRKALGAAGAAIETRPSGYLLRLEPGQLDLDRFERLLADAQGGAADVTATKLREALDLWRGQPLAEFAYEDFAQAALGRLEELRMAALERRIDADLDLGRHSEVVGELEQVIEGNPLRERPRAQLMLALYRCDRQAEALDAFQKTRHLLVEELGIEPGPALRELETLILNHDPRLQLAGAKPAEDAGVAANTPSEAPIQDTVAPAPVRRERKFVTVLACELDASNQNSSAEDLEDLQMRVEREREGLRAVIESFGGTIERFVGSGMVAVFGAPVAHEDDAERAVRAALRILEVTQGSEGNPGAKTRARIGIDTGEAIVSIGAMSDPREGTIVGAVVDTATRIQSSVEGEGIAVSVATHRRTTRVFLYESRSPIQEDGAESIELFQPLERRGRLGIGLMRTQDTPFVGREIETRLLEDLFDRSARGRSPQLVTLVGEPGIGKSRLVSELCTYTESSPELVTWRQGRCLSYGDGIALWALGEVVKAQAGIFESDTPEVATEKLKGVLPEGEEQPWLMTRLLPLLGIESGQATSRDESFAAWRQFLESVACDRPAVVVIEDLHWADPALLDFLGYLAEWAVDVPLLVLGTTRPELYERHPGFGANARNATVINLAPLSDKETARLIGLLLNRVVLPAGTQQLLLERAGGNPLYAEEFVRVIRDRGAERAELPDSLQALIAARLDALSPERKGLLQAAAVVGKVFWAGALAEMEDRSLTEVRQALHELARNELVRPSRSSSIESESEYSFLHGLVRDVCYSQIPRAARIERHRRAAGWLERKTGDRLEDLADVLAHHYLTAIELSLAAALPDDAELQEQAIRYLGLAGERALGLDVERAEQRLARALELAPEDHPQRPVLLERWAQAARSQGRLREARDALEQALSVYRERDDQLAVGRTLCALSSVLTRLADPRHDETLAEALRLLEVQPTSPELVSAYAQLSSEHRLNAAFEKTITAADKALALAARLGLPEPATALGDRGCARAFLGEVEGVDETRRALTLAVEKGEGRAAAILYNNLTLAVYLYEGPRAALTVLQDGIGFSRARGLADMAEFMAAGEPEDLAELGRVEQAFATASEFAERLEQAGDVGFIAPRSLELQLLTERGNPEQATDPETMLAAARDSGQPQLMAIAVLAAAPLLIAQGDRDQAGALLTELSRVERIRDDGIYASYLVSLVRTALALEDLDLAGSFVAGVKPVTPLHSRALTACRGQLAEAAGELEEAAALFAEAAIGWHAWGNVPERAYALLGQGRCLSALGKPQAEQPLREARELFASMGYRTALAETAAFLAQPEHAAS